MGKRYHITGDVWLVREGHYMPDYAVMVGDKKVADFYFWRGIDKNGPHIDSRLTWLDTSVCVTDFASYFKDAMRYLRGWDWTRPAPTSLEELREVYAGYRRRFPSHSEPSRSEAMREATWWAKKITQDTGRKYTFRWYGEGYETVPVEDVTPAF